MSTEPNVPTCVSDRSLGRCGRVGPARILGLIVLFLSASPARSQERPAEPSGTAETKLAAGVESVPHGLWDAAAATAVIFNSDVPESVAIARFYASERGIPDSHLIGISCSAAETITRDQYDSTIRDPLVRILTERGFWKFSKPESGKIRTVEARSIRILAPIYGIPVRIDRLKSGDGKRRDVPAGKGDEASVDSELALLGTSDLSTEGPLKNPYFKQDAPFSSLENPPIFLVARLDGPSPEVVHRMIADSITTEKSGLRGFAYFDLAKKGAGYESGDLWISGSEELLRGAGFPTVVDHFPDCFPIYYPLHHASVYFGWYTGHIDGPFLNPEFAFTRGAIACHLHSFSAQELRQSTRHWTGPLLRRGAAASLGSVWEPYLALTVHFDILTDRLLKGYTFAEASSMATPALSWMNVAVGDPLYRPFKSRLVAPITVAETGSTKLSDLALFQKIAATSTGQSEAEQKRALVEAAAKRESGLLLEGAGLLSAASSRYSEAIDLFDHAAATYNSEPNKIRALLHIADMHRRSEDIPTAISTLEKILSTYPDATESRAAKEFLKRLKKK